MDSALWTAKSGLEAHHKNIGIISNNLANANTIGFKKNRPEFQDLAYQVIKQPGAATTEVTNSPSGIVVGTGVKCKYTINQSLLIREPVLCKLMNWDN
mgnify:CR=1 FL=1